MNNLTRPQKAVTLTDAIDSIDQQMQKQKRKVLYAQGAAKKCASLKEALDFQSATNVASEQMRSMRLNRVRVEDAAQHCIENSSPEAFEPFTQMFPDCAKLLARSFEKTNSTSNVSSLISA